MSLHAPSPPSSSVSLTAHDRPPVSGRSDAGILILEKYHGIGNDFLILLDLRGDTDMDADQAIRLCDRHLGLGADGLIRSRPAPGGDDATLTFELWNADGSRAELSGNGLRCLAHAALEAGIVADGVPFGVLTPVGRREVTVRSTGPGLAWGSAEMGTAVVEGEADRCNIGHGQLLVNMGNPHLVVLGPDPATLDVGRLGPILEATAPEGLNVEFVTLGPGRDEVTMRVWERGVGETQACGTGSCAAAVALHHWGRVGTEVTVHQLGGTVAVSLRPDRSVALAGPSQRVGTSHVDPSILGAGVGAPGAAAAAGTGKAFS